jgi:hypothetical protein
MIFLSMNMYILFFIRVATEKNTDAWMNECTFEKSGVMWTFRTIKTTVFEPSFINTLI